MMALYSHHHCSGGLAPSSSAPRQCASQSSHLQMLMLRCDACASSSLSLEGCRSAQLACGLHACMSKCMAETVTFYEKALWDELASPFQNAQTLVNSSLPYKLPGW